MDVNYYLHREQIERVRAQKAGPGAVGEAHRGLAELYREQIERYRVSSEAPARPQPQG